MYFSGGGELKTVRVESVNEIAEKVYILEFKRFFDFEAGQIIKMAISSGDDPRLYSIASGEGEDTIQVLFNVVDEGRLTPSMACLQPGDKIQVSRGFGKFTGTTGKAWWIAQGTGVAPFASMFRSGQVIDKTLVHGGRTRSSFYYSDEFLPVLGDKYIRCCSRETGDGLFHGRVTDYLAELPSLPAEPLYYLCGSSEMVVESRDILIGKGVPFKNIVGEIYF
jgi:ferredoxin--NADP+ reductase